MTMRMMRTIKNKKHDNVLFSAIWKFKICWTKHILLFWFANTLRHLHILYVNIYVYVYVQVIQFACPLCCLKQTQARKGAALQAAL